jgi:hypothetical protein
MTPNQKADLDREMNYVGRDWTPLNRVQRRERAWLELIAILVAFGACAAFWEGFAWVLKLVHR